LAALAVVVAPALHAADFATEYNAKMAAGRKERQKGDWKTAAEHFRDAAKLAGDAKSQPQQAEAALEAALCARALLKSEPDNTAWQREVVKYYSTVIALGYPEQVELACNNLGVYYYEVGKYAKAVAVFEKVLSPTGPDAYAYNYNWANALREIAVPQTAMPQAAFRYRRALELRPGFAPAAEGLVTFLLKDEKHRFDEANWLLDHLLMNATNNQDTAQAALAGEYALRFLQAWGGVPGAAAFFPRLLTAYDRAEIGPLEFERTVLKTGRLGKVRAHAGCAARTDELQLLYQGNLAAKGGRLLFIGRDEVLQALPGWREVCDWYPECSPTLSRVLKRAADAYYHAAKPSAGATGRSNGAPEIAARRALARYSAAHALDPHNSEAVVYALATLSEHEAALDQGGQLLEEYRRAVFDNKAGLYPNANTPDDWRVIYRCHVVLADRADKLRRWGPEADPNSALYQLSRARNAARNLPNSPYAGVTPLWIETGLARAYEGTKNYRRAADAYIRVAERLIQGGNSGEAEEAFLTAARIGKEHSPADWSDRDRQKIKWLTRLAGNAGKVEQRVTFPTGDVFAVKFRPDGKSLVWGGKSGTGSWIIGASKQPILAPWGQVSGWQTLPIMTAMAFTKDASLFACSEQGGVSLWSNLWAPSFCWHYSLPALGTDVAFAPDGQTVAVAAADGAVRILDVWTQELLKTLAGPKAEVVRVAFSQDGRLAATAGGSTLILWDASRGQKLATLAGHTDAVTAIRFHPGKPLLATGDSGGAVRLWELTGSGGRARATLSGDRGAITALDWSPGPGRLLGTGTERGATILWDFEKKHEVAWLSPFRAKVSSIAFSSDGKSVAVAQERGAGMNTEVAMWDVGGLVDKDTSTRSSRGPGREAGAARPY
jgi:WD40 repeat protein/tetratricopeptide (TPR) repeat protein